MKMRYPVILIIGIIGFIAFLIHQEVIKLATWQIYMLVGVSAVISSVVLVVTKKREIIKFFRQKKIILKDYNEIAEEELMKNLDIETIPAVDMQWSDDGKKVVVFRKAINTRLRNSQVREGEIIMVVMDLNGKVSKRIRRIFDSLPPIDLKQNPFPSEQRYVEKIVERPAMERETIRQPEGEEI